MTDLRVYFKDIEKLGRTFERSVRKNAADVRSSMRGAAQDFAAVFLARGRADISSAGNFGKRWTDGLHAEVTEGGGTIRITIDHDVPYATVFEYGKVIHGDPLLWIPLSFAKDAVGVMARDYPLPLFRVDRKNGQAPLLMAWEPGAPELGAFPKYFGKESVTIPQKFHLRQIARDVSKEMSSFFKARFKVTNNG